MPRSLIGLGSNLGDRQETLERAIGLLSQTGQIAIVARSGWRETAPVGGPPGQPPFLNAAVLVETSLSPQGLLATMQDIEASLGRKRAQRWSARTIDLDLLLFDQAVSSTPSLDLPHPRMAWRRFVLEPAAEVAPAMIHPTTGWTVARLLDHLNSAAPYVAFAGPIGVGKTLLSERLAKRTPARRIEEQIDLDRLGAFYADPSGLAWATELEFLLERARLLAADAPAWAVRAQLAVSDFWFDQSLAFARVWLPQDQIEPFTRRFDELRPDVVRPKLIVLLDLAADGLLERIRRRGRPCELGLSREQLEQIRQSILLQAAQPNQGPILRLTNQDVEATLPEVLAAVQAMA